MTLSSGSRAPVMVTGADGFLGSNLVPELLRRGHRIRALVQPGRAAGGLAGSPIEIVRGDILDPLPRLVEAVAGCAAVVHCAAIVRLWPPRAEQTRKVNIEGTARLAEAAIAAGVERFVYVGRASSFEPGTLAEPGAESSPCPQGRSRLDYFDSKLVAQQLVLRAHAERALPAIVVNPTFMLGPFGDPRGSTSLLIALHDGRVPGWSRGGRNFVYVGDVATAIANALQRGRPGQCYILGNENLPYREAFRRFCAAMGVPAPRLPIPAPAVWAAALLQSCRARLTGTAPELGLAAARAACGGYYYTSRKAVDELALPQTPLERAVQEAIDWHRRSGHLSKK